MKVLITGGAGFIGSHLARQLSEGSEVRILDNLRSGRAENVAGLAVKFFEASVMDGGALKQAVAGVDVVFHLAAFTSVAESMQAPRECVEINTLGTLNVLEAAAGAGVRKLVFASTAAVYGDDPEVPTPETAMPAPKSPYAISKLDGEYYCRLFTSEGLLETACLRFFNVFGPGQDPQSAYAAAVPAFLHRALHGEPLVIFGDGEQSRDFVYVEDIVSGLVFAAGEGVTGAFNCGYGCETTINELVSLILASANSKSPVQHGPARRGDVRRSCAANEKLLAAGWRPVSSLSAGLRATVKAFRDS